ncbi:hypothetical protein [Corticicoccus populi]|uniref:SlyX family protein n=1 Tax=Corticicoccus populi TaxID=1812821 RepID=A0ABW5WV79_9STAP
MKKLEDMTQEELIQQVVVLEKAINKLASRVANVEVNYAILEAQIPEQNEQVQP